MRTIRIASAGQWHTHGRDFSERVSRIAGAELAAVWDEDPAQARQWAQERGCRAAASYRALLNDPSIDGIILTTPTARHTEQILAALEAGKSLYVEKALTVNREEAYRIRDAVHRAEREKRCKVILSDPVCKPYLQYAKEAMESGLLGEIHFVRIRISHDLALCEPQKVEIYLKKAESGGGVLLDMGHHAVHTLYYLLGRPVRAMAMLDQASRLAQTHGTEDVCAVMYQYENGVIATAESGLVIPRPQNTLEICGTNGVLTYYPSQGMKLLDRTGRMTDIPAAAYPPPRMAPMDEWIACIRENTPIQAYTVDDAVAVMEMIDAAYRSRQQAVTL